MTIIFIGILFLFIGFRFAEEAVLNRRLQNTAKKEFSLQFPEFRAIDFSIGSEIDVNHKIVEVKYYDPDKDTTSQIFMQFRNSELVKIYNSDLEYIDFEYKEKNE